MMSQKSHSANESSESPRSPRLALPAMYTLVRVRPKGQSRYLWTGHIYDLSETGMRFELDNPIAPGSEVDIRAMLPGHMRTTVHATGTVVRLHDDADELGPIRMGMHFQSFAKQVDRNKLQTYIHQNQSKAA